MVLVIGGYAQGKRAFVEEKFPEREIWENFHLFVREKMEQGVCLAQIQAEVLARIEQSPKVSIISTELGCGIVPMEAFDRSWREVTGRLLCMLAEKAEMVYRVSLGIGVKIK